MTGFIKKTKKTAAIFLAVMLVAASFCGCKSNKQMGQVNIEQSTPIVHEMPINGGVLSMPMPMNASIGNPYTVDTEEMLNFFSLIYEGLVEIDETNTLTPALAENWSSDESMRVWTFNLRKDAKWHSDGDGFNARDVKYSYDAILNMAGESYYSYNVSKIESVEIIDSYSVRITMKEKGVLPLRCLNFPIVKNGASLTSKPVGTGPYAYESKDEETVTLKANELWWKQRPYISSVKFIARDSNETALASFSAGQFNFVPTSAITAGKYRQEGVANVTDVMTQDMEVLLINHSNSLLKNIKIRQALAYLINRTELISNVCMNRARACDVPVAPDSWFYDSKSKLYDHSITKAEELLKAELCVDNNEDGILEKNGEDISFRLLVCTSLDGTRADAAKQIAQQLLDAGIKTEITLAAYSADGGGEFMEKLENGEYDIALVGFNMARDCDLSPYFGYEGECRFGGYYSLELENAASEMYNAANDSELQQKASDFQLCFIEELPFIVLYFRLNSIVYSSQIKALETAREPDIMRNVEKWYISDNK